MLRRDEPACCEFITQYGRRAAEALRPHLAFIAANFPQARELLRRIRLDAGELRGFALHAAFTGNAATFRDALALGADLAGVEVAIHAATEDARLAIVAAAIAAGASFRGAENPSLARAIAVGQPAAVRALLAAGAPLRPGEAAKACALEREEVFAADRARSALLARAARAIARAGFEALYRPGGEGYLRARASFCALAGAR